MSTFGFIFEGEMRVSDVVIFEGEMRVSDVVNFGHALVAAVPST